MTVHVYMDVDGVLNGLSRLPGHGDWDLKTRRVEGVENLPWGRFRIRWYQELMDELRGIEAEFFWLTTWEDAAPRLLSPLFGIGAEWPVVFKQDLETYGANWWKRRALEAHLAETRPDSWVWCDDDIMAEMGYHPLVLSGIPGRCVEPEPAVGLTRRDVQRIKDLVNPGQEGAPK